MSSKSNQIFCKDILHIF